MSSYHKQLSGDFLVECIERGNNSSRGNIDYILTDKRQDSRLTTKVVNNALQIMDVTIPITNVGQREFDYVEGNVDVRVEYSADFESITVYYGVNFRDPTEHQKQFIYMGAKVATPVAPPAGSQLYTLEVYKYEETFPQGVIQRADTQYTKDILVHYTAVPTLSKPLGTSLEIEIDGEVVAFNEFITRVSSSETTYSQLLYKDILVNEDTFHLETTLVVYDNTTPSLTIRSTTIHEYSGTKK